MRREHPLVEILVDADACPVKQETYKVARRYNIVVVLVSNSWMRAPVDPLISIEVVGGISADQCGAILQDFFRSRRG